MAFSAYSAMSLKVIGIVFFLSCLHDFVQDVFPDSRLRSALHHEVDFNVKFAAQKPLKTDKPEKLWSLFKINQDIKVALTFLLSSHKGTKYSQRAYPVLFLELRLKPFQDLNFFFNTAHYLFIVSLGE